MLKWFVGGWVAGVAYILYKIRLNLLLKHIRKRSTHVAVIRAKHIMTTDKISLNYHDGRLAVEKMLGWKVFGFTVPYTEVLCAPLIAEQSKNQLNICYTGTPESLFINVFEYMAPCLDKEFSEYAKLNGAIPITCDLLLIPSNAPLPTWRFWKFYNNGVGHHECCYCGTSIIQALKKRAIITILCCFHQTQPLLPKDIRQYIVNLL